MWHPEIGPIVYAIVSRVKPNASATPTNSDAQLRERRRNHGASATAENEPKRAEKLRPNASREWHDVIPFRERSYC